jgi:UDP-N-acetylmuramyl pentapeptide phosphotransferase/UDP-N-acetylglucosamine-1-phosphate transferase
VRDLLAWVLPALLLAAAVVYRATSALLRRPPASLLDVPNERSSHHQPVPRGGGIAIVLVVLGGVTLQALVTGRLAALGPFLVGGALVAGVSLYDDVRSLATGPRLAAHLAAALLALWGYTEARGLPLPLAGEAGWASAVVTCVWIVGLINAYNFMDGIDGLAAAQAVIAGLAWGVLGVAFGSAEVALIGALAAGGALGFLPFNRAPARIFLGDVGSAFLGYTFAVLPLLLGAHPRAWLAAVSIVSVFVFDTVFTFLRRLWHREPVLRAHRSHLYQRLVIAGRSHRAVTRLYAALAALLAAAGVAAVFGDGRWGLLTIAAALTAGLMLWRYVRTMERRVPQEARPG